MTNYRPICLTAVIYRIYASKVKQCLLDAGLDGRLWKSQFGFRAGRSTEDAIYVARRRIELALAQRGGSISLLALDWARAFDSVSPAALCNSLKHFWLPVQFVVMVEGFYHDRQFFVREGGVDCSLRRQKFGISQGKNKMRKMTQL